MQKYQDYLKKNRAILDRELKSSGAGIDFDQQTVLNPRRHGITVQPAIGLISEAHSTFF
jgi:hypothetical protein